MSDAASLADLAGQAANAVLVSLNAYAGAAERTAAFEFLSTFQDSPAVLECAPLLIEHENASVRHYGLRAVQSLVAYGWASLADEQREHVKYLALGLLTSGALLADEKYVREKAVDIAIQVAVYDWPHQWPNLLDVLLGCVGEPGCQTDMALMALRSLVEKIGFLSNSFVEQSNNSLIVTEHITPSRARQLTSALAASEDSLFAVANHVLSSFQLALGNPAVADSLLAAVDFVRTLVEFGPLDALAQGETASVLGLLVACYSLPGVMSSTSRLRFRVTDALLACVSRDTIVGAPAAAVCRLFEHYPALVAAYDASVQLMAAADESGAATEHRFQSQLVDVLVALGMFALRVYRRLAFSEVTGVPLAPNFPAYIGELVRLATSTLSMRSAESLSSVLLGVLQLHGLAAPTLQDLTAGLMPLAAALAAQASPLTQPHPAPFVASLDCDSEDEVKKLLKRLHRRGHGLMRAYTRFDATSAIDFIGQYVPYVFDSIQSSSSHAQGAVCSNDTPEWQGLNAAALLVDAVLSSLAPGLLAALSDMPGGAELEHRLRASMGPDERAQYEAQQTGEAAKRGVIAETLTMLLSGVLAFRTPSPHLKSRHLAIIEAFAPFLQHFPALLPDTLNFCVEMLSYRQPSEEAQHADALCGTTLVVRERAAHVLSALASCVGVGLVPVLPDLWQHVSALVRTGQLRRSEIVSVFDSVLLVLANSPDVELQHSLVALMIDPVLEDWASDSFCSLIGSAESLLTGLGLASAPGPGQGVFSEEAVRTRERLYHLVSIVRSVLRHSERMDATVLAKNQDAICGPAFALVRALGAIRSPQVLAQVPEAFGAVFDLADEAPDDDARASRVGELSLGEPADEQLVLMRWWLQAVHVDAIEIVTGLLRGAGIYGLANAGELIHEALIANLADVPLSIVRVTICSALLTLRRTTPEDRKADLMLPLVYGALEALHVRLGGEWVAFGERERARLGLGGASAGAGEERAAAHQLAHQASGQSEAQEILRDNELRNCTGGLGTLMRSLTFRLDTAAPDHDAEQSGVAVPVEIIFLCSEANSALFVAVVLDLLHWPHVTSMATGAMLLEKMVPIFGPSLAGFHAMLGEDGLPALVHCISLMDEPGSIRFVLDALIAVYKALLPTAHAALNEYFSALPGVTAEALGEFDRLLISGSGTARQQSNMLKKMLVSVIGANITSALFKREMTVVGSLTGAANYADADADADGD